MRYQSFARMVVIAALLLLTVTIVNAQAPLPAPDAPDVRIGAFEPDVPFAVPAEYEHLTRAGWVVTTTGVDEDNGSCDLTPGGSVSLREAILYCPALGVTTIYVNPGTYILNDAIITTGTTSLAIIGAGPLSTIIHVKDAPCTNYCAALDFGTLNNVALAIFNLTFENADLAGFPGGALVGGGTGTVDIYNVRFTGNAAQTGGAAALLAVNGALHVSVRSSTFSGNSADFAGGALFVGSDDATSTMAAHISQSSFVQNTVGDACTTSSGGGAIMMLSDVPGSGLTIDDSEFSQNSSECHGGAVNVQSTAPVNLSITRGVFSDNATGTSDGFLGGAVNFNSPGTLIVNSSEFDDNTAMFGGAIEAAGASQAVIGSSTFKGNSAAAFGGAIDLFDVRIGTLTNSFLLHNSADTGGGASFRGTVVTVTGTEVSLNSASSSGGGLYVDDPGVNIQSSGLLDNTAPSGPDCLTNGGLGLASLGNVWLTSTANCAFISQPGDDLDNLLVNGGFETAGSNAKKPLGWTLAGISGDKRICNGVTFYAATGDCAFVFSGGGASASISQDIAGSAFSGGDKLKISAFGNGTSSKLRLDLTIKYAGGTKQKIKLSINGNTAGYSHRTSNEFTLPAGTITGATLKISDTAGSGKFYLDTVFVFVSTAAPRDTRSGESVLPPPSAPSGFRGTK